MKYWLFSLIVIAGCGGALTWLIRGTIIPAFLASANREMVADWKAGLTECRAETGKWPDPTDEKSFGEQVYIIPGADGRRIPGGYMHARPSRYEGGVLYDVYDQPMRLSFTADSVLLASAGPNRTWGDADDVTSDQFTERYRPSTLAQARAEAEARAKKKK